MTTTVMTTKGQIVIPSLVREHFNMKKGTRLCVIEEAGRIVLQPLTKGYFERAAGILKTKGKLTRLLLEERAMEMRREDRA